MKASDDIMSLKGIGEKLQNYFIRLEFMKSGSSSNITPGIISPFQSLYT